MGSGQLVVGAVVVRAGRVLAARRTTPAELAGHWEFPGGKVEPGEAPYDALVRELREELGVTVEVDGEVGDSWPLSERSQLRLYRCRLVDGEPEPDGSHDAVRWLADGELDDLAWLPVDRLALPDVRAVLA